MKVTIIGHNELSLITFWDHFLFILTCVISGASVAHVTAKKGVHVKCARHLRTYFLTVYGAPLLELHIALMNQHMQGSSCTQIWPRCAPRHVS